jgi:hypothetical protein
MRNLGILLLVVGAFVLVLSVPVQILAAQDATTTQPAHANSVPATSTVTGCLMGSKNQYSVTEKDGTRHVLLAKGKDLSTYVNHEVTVTGKADSNRDASASSDEGTAHGNRFFAVDSVTDQGACKK